MPVYINHALHCMKELNAPMGKMTLTFFLTKTFHQAVAESCAPKIFYEGRVDNRYMHFTK